MKCTVKLALFSFLLLASMGHSVKLKLDLMTDKTTKIGKNGFFHLSEIEDTCDYSGERFPKAYDATTHHLTLENVTQAHLEKRSKAIGLKEDNGTLHFSFTVSTTPLTTGKSEEEDHYCYTFKASLPVTVFELDQTIPLKPVRIQYLEARRTSSFIDHRQWVDFKVD
jgi:hypothetical protein